MTTLYLSPATWDLCVDANGNIAVASGPYALAQDVASAVRCFLGELYYDTTQGVPYWQEILGKYPPLSLVKAKIEAAALTVPNVVSATCYIASFTNRTIKGQITITDNLGNTATASF